MPVLMRSRLLENVHQAQWKEVEENPGKFLAVVPIGAGAGWASFFLNAEKEILAFIKGIDLPGSESLDLIAA